MGHAICDAKNAISKVGNALSSGVCDAIHGRILCTAKDAYNGSIGTLKCGAQGISDTYCAVKHNPKLLLAAAAMVVAPELAAFYAPMVGGSALAAGALTGATIGGVEGGINGGNLCSALKGAVAGGVSGGLGGVGGMLGSSAGNSLDGALGSRLGGYLGSKAGGYLASQVNQDLVGKPTQAAQSPYQSTIPSGGYVGCQPLNPMSQLNTLPQSVYAGSMAGMQPQTGGLVNGCTPMSSQTDSQSGLAPLQAIYTPPATQATAVPPCSPYAPITGSQGVRMAHMAEGGVITGIGGLAHGGLPSQHHPDAPEGHHPEFITGKTGFYARGKGTGQSDDIPAMLHQGDFVMDADTVSAFGDGSSKAGADRLEQFRQSLPVRKAEGGTALPAKIADGEYVLPAAFVTRLGGNDNKRGAELLNKMREELRAHKRSAPDDKIPPKAKPPMEYLRMARG